MKKYVVICDIDNCFVDSREWHKHIPEDNSRAGWDKCLDNINLCKPNEPVIAMVCATAALHPIIFITGREDRKNCRHDTIVQLKEFSHGVIDMQDPECPHKLLMRSEFDYRPSQIMKEEKLLEVIRNNCIPVIAIDDEIENCKMFMRYSIPTLHYDIETNDFKKCVMEDKACAEN